VAFGPCGFESRSPHHLRSLRPVSDIRPAQALIVINRVNGGEYPRYMFSNVSTDILGLCTRTLDQLGVHWTTANSRNIAASRRPDVEYLDTFIGPKW
jgi:hypothetical protein